MTSANRWVKMWRGQVEVSQKNLRLRSCRRGAPAQRDGSERDYRGRTGAWRHWRRRGPQARGHTIESAEDVDVEGAGTHLTPTLTRLWPFLDSTQGRQQGPCSRSTALLPRASLQCGRFIAGTRVAPNSANLQSPAVYRHRPGCLPLASRGRRAHEGATESAQTFHAGTPLPERCPRPRIHRLAPGVKWLAVLCSGQERESGGSRRDRYTSLRLALRAHRHPR